MSNKYPGSGDPPLRSSGTKDGNDTTRENSGSFVKLPGTDDISANVPCPWCEKMFGTSAVYQCCCCCFWNHDDRRKCAIGMLYSKAYLLLYACIIALTLTLVVYDIRTGFERLKKHPPGWFVALDITCVALMVTDVFIQILANPRGYWKSAANVFDFIVVAICVIGVPVYFYVPQSDVIVTVVLLLRFAAQLLRIIMIYRHQRDRSAYIDAATNDIVDFSTFQDSADIARNQGIADDGQLLALKSSLESNGTKDTSEMMRSSYSKSAENSNQQSSYAAASSGADLSRNIKEMTPEWTVMDVKVEKANNANAPNASNASNAANEPNDASNGMNGMNDMNGLHEKSPLYPNLRKGVDGKQVNEKSGLTKVNVHVGKGYDSMSETDRGNDGRDDSTSQKIGARTPVVASDADNEDDQGGIDPVFF